MLSNSDYLACRSLTPCALWHRDIYNFLIEIENNKRKIINTKKEIIKRYNLPEEFKHWIKVVDKYVFLHDQRKEAQVKSIYAYYLLMYELARRLKLNKKDLEWLWHQEVKELLKGKSLDKEEIKKRKRAVAVLVDKDVFKNFSGNEAENIHKKEFNLNIKGSKIIKGMGATRGLVKARVKVCAGAEESLRKIKKGDILVCSMTLPDYVPAMKKSCAIITDEGGITCHAAIISRELNIPCIVGTKIATEVLKDGDLVELDAYHGVIKII
jgi:phosphoenolpyruvate synthase/pyruvate phosphate dikinase